MRIYLTFVICFCFIQATAQNQETLLTRSWLKENEHSLLDAYLRFLSIPNIAADRLGLQATADSIMGMMRIAGIQGIQKLEATTAGVPPAVYGEVKTPGATRTIIFYAHYDGQPVNPANWQKGLKPFEPVIANGPLGKDFMIITDWRERSAIHPLWRIFGRSSSDDKAGVMAIISAYRALRATGRNPGVNIKFFFEGEEEAGSPHLHEILQRYKDLLQGDLWIICDGPVHQSGKKSIVFGVRGDTNLELIIHGPRKPLHSGHYGNWVQNPAWQLVHLLTTMKNENGEVTIKGFYDDVSPLSELEKKALRDIPPVEDQLKGELGILQTERQERLYNTYNLPTLNINGIRSADVGALAANVIPVKASVVLDLRLVAGNDWKRQQDKVIDHIRQQGYEVLDHEPTDDDRQRYAKIIQVIRDDGYNAQKTRLDIPEAQQVIRAISSTTADQVVLLPTSGGSLPLFLFEKYLHAKTITVPLANHDNNQHAENENLRIGNLWGGIETMAAIMQMK